jgi:hypothetical protein
MAFDQTDATSGEKLMSRLLWSRYSAWLLLASAGLAQAGLAAATPSACGEVVSVATHEQTTMRYAFRPPAPIAPADSTAGAPPTPSVTPVTLALLAGGPGLLKLDQNGCPHALTGNWLVRAVPLFNALGFATALIDAPSDYQGDDGLAGFRSNPQHAVDLGKLIASLRARSHGAVWLIGTSRGTISAANAASRLTGALAPDGVVLTSALMAGQLSARKTWVAQTVFDLPLEHITMPLLVTGHAADTCIRSPAARMGEISARTKGVRQQVVTVTGGQGWTGAADTSACQGHAPHGYVGQEQEVADGIARFVRGGKY